MNRTDVWRIAGVVLGIAAIVLIGCAVAAAQGRLWGIGLGNAARGWFICAATIPAVIAGMLYRKSR